MAEFADLSPDVFRTAARDWLAANFPRSLAGLTAPLSGFDELEGPAEDQAAWKARMAAQGWGAATWPTVYGGGGLSVDQANVLAEEMAAIGAFNPITGNGLMMLGPTLLEVGDEAQKRRHLPPIARGEVVWCQGFSEPGAGSDLASLRMACEDRGDHWLVNGQKVWTSYANHADWCFALVRTDTTRKQAGISFLLIDMASPGIEARPIRLINGVSHFCETFFDDVRVPKENLVGELNAGWGIAKRLLQHERSGLSALRAAGSATYDLPGLARRYVGIDTTGRLADPDLRGRLADHLMLDEAYRLTAQRRGAEAAAELNPTTPVSTLKNIGAVVGQTRGELAIEILGLAGLGAAGDGYSDEELEWTSHWLHSKCYSIYGGSHEIQNNITATRELGLPAA